MPNPHNSIALPPRSLSFPEDEARLPWLGILLDAYDVIDRGITLALQREKRKHNRRPACREGCGGCCRTHTDIPLYPLEMTGIYWYVIEKTDLVFRQTLANNLAGHTPSSPCPFLAEDACSIYPVRPVACRQFIVFGRPCGEGEDPYHTRRADVLTPLPDFRDKAFYIMLPFYGITKEAEKKAAIRNNIIHARVRNLKTVDWGPLAQRIAESLHEPEGTDGSENCREAQ
ncbi:MAG: YkgJ family cysteine cluster protein [Thermodesulfovibrionales bacterium]